MEVNSTASGATFVRLHEPQLLEHSNESSSSSSSKVSTSFHSPADNTTLEADDCSTFKSTHSDDHGSSDPVESLLFISLPQTREQNSALSSVGLNNIDSDKSISNQPNDRYNSYGTSCKNHSNLPAPSTNEITANMRALECKNPSSSGRGTSSSRNISRSMLELDGKNTDGKFTVSWNNLNFSHGPSVFSILRYGSTKETNVLKNLSGSFQSNQLVAIIGPSGSGKTSLLHFLSGNNDAHRNKVRISGLDEPKVSFIGQGDCLLPNLTTQETLVYASRLQNPKPGFNHEKHIKPILRGLGLNECAGRSVTELSGGQAKRVTIGQELLYPTNLLILDEITSGLDASTSYSIIKLLKQLASDTNYPMAIVISIHQPSAKLFSVFDRVYVMSEGCCLYEGSCDIDTINSHLKLFDLECPKFHNIADYLIEIASDDLGMDVIEARRRMVEYQAKQNDYSQRCQTNGSPNGLTSQSDSVEAPFIKQVNHSEMRIKLGIEEEPEAVNDLDEESQTKVAMLYDSLETDHSCSLYDAIERSRNRREKPFLEHLIIHFRRSMLRVSRSRILTYLQMITYILLGVQLATFYGPDIGKLSGCPLLPMSFINFMLTDQPEDTITEEMHRLQENLNLLLVSVMTITFAALEITVISFPLEAKTVKREWRNGRYRVSSYFVGRTLADLPFTFVCSLVFSLLIYGLTSQIGLTTWRFGVYLLVMILIALIAQSVGFAFGAIFMDNLPAAVFTAPLCIFPNLLYSGFFARVSQVPYIYRILSYTSHFRFAFHSLIITLYGFERCGCDQRVLDQYHKNLAMQTDGMRDLFKKTLGTPSCTTDNTPIDMSSNTIEETTGFSGDINSIIANETSTTPSVGMMANMTSSSTTTVSPSSAFDDALAESVFHYISKPNTTYNPHANISAVDHVMSQFAGKMTQMFDVRNNFGRPTPIDCKNLDSYLMGEFEITEYDLISGLIVLAFMVLISRIMCNMILTMTMKAKVD